MKLDLSNKNLDRIDIPYFKTLFQSIDTIAECENDDKIEDTQTDFIKTATFDNNSLSKLDNIELFLPYTKKLSLSNNQLVDIKSISNLNHLQFINLSNNSLASLEPIKELTNLKWLNLSSNQIKTLDPLMNSINIEYIDASDNIIKEIPNFSVLKNLKSLNLNTNEIRMLKCCPVYLPVSLEELFLAYNFIDDLNEINFLSCLKNLTTLYINNNECITMYDGLFNYRPYILSWCSNLTILNDVDITEDEYKKAQFIASSKKGHLLCSNKSQTDDLVDFLIANCPLNQV
jgi:Leucine-rich repeat (LRR) protein